MSAASPALRLVLAGLVLGQGGACGAGGATPLTIASDFAIGWEGELDGPLLLADCTPSPQAVAPLFTSVGSQGRAWFRATATGRVTLRCGKDDLWVVRVLEPATFAVKAPATLVMGQRATAVLEGFAAGGEKLALGAFSDIAWKTTGAVRKADSLPHDFIGAAIQLHSDVAMFSIEGAAPGTGTVSAASWRGRPVHASTTIAVTAAPRPDR